MISRVIFIVAFIVAFTLPDPGMAVQVVENIHCPKLSTAGFNERLNGWGGKTLVAISSWCTSCKDSLLAAQKHPKDFVFITVFDDEQAMEKVLNRFDVKSECISGENLTELLKIDALPWSRNLDANGVLKVSPAEKIDLRN